VQWWQPDAEVHHVRGLRFSVTGANGVAYDSEAMTDTTRTGSNTDCWYATNPEAAQGTLLACGSPQCLRIDDPAPVVADLQPGDAPVGATIVAALVLLLLLGMCALPSLCPWVGIRDADGAATKADVESGKKNGIVDEDWDDLNDEQRAAATTLGYNKKSWDKDKSVPAEDKDWSELTSAEKGAARVLGYTQASWDADA